MESVIMRLLDLPPGVNGLTVKDENGDYNIYINARISDSERVRAFRHEAQHIRLGHFYNAAEACALENVIRERSRSYSTRPSCRRLLCVWNRTVAVLTGLRFSAQKVNEPHPSNKRHKQQ